MPDTSMAYSYFFGRVYTDKFTQFQKLRDTFAGNERIKEAGTVYLPQPGGMADADYVSYKARTLFYPVIERTVRGLLGIIFRVQPVIELPEALQPMLDSVTPEGDSLLEAFRIAVRETLHMGRHGLLLDMPEAAPPTQNPYIAQYAAENITCWERRYLNGGRRLTKVMLRDAADSDGNDVEQFSELFLDYALNDNGNMVGEPVYRIRKWRVQIDYKGHTVKPLGEPKVVTPTIQGKTLNYIPFYFINPYSNKPDLEKSPMMDLADANISHYTLDADYRHTLFMVAQPTPYLVGDLADAEVPKKIGASAFWVLPSKVTEIGMLEFSGAGIGALDAALTKREEYMAALGAKLIHRQRQPETAEAVRTRSRDEISIIESVVQSAEEAFYACLCDAARWRSANHEEIKARINKDFVEGKMDPAMLTALVKTWATDHAISRDVYHSNLQRGEIMPPNRTVKEEREAIAQDKLLDGDPVVGPVLLSPGGPDNHTHTAELDEMGNAVSSSDMGHTHEIKGREVQSAGETPHKHLLAPVPGQEPDEPNPEDVEVDTTGMTPEEAEAAIAAAELAKTKQPPVPPRPPMPPAK